MYTLYIPWVICDLEVNFGVMPVKNTHELKPVTHKTCSLDAKLFLEKKSSALQYFNKKMDRTQSMTQRCVLIGL